MLKQAGGDRVMAQMLAAIPIHGLEAVLVAAELALEVGRVSGEHVLNVLARLKSPMAIPLVEAVLTLTEEPLANVARYDELRKETCHER